MAAIAVSAKHADATRLGETHDQVRENHRSLQIEPARHDRTVRVSLSLADPAATEMRPGRRAEAI